MSNFPVSTGNQVGAAAQGASAAPSIEALLSQLGDTHRTVLTQAQVLGKAAGDWLASACPTLDGHNMFHIEAKSGIAVLNRNANLPGDSDPRS